MLKAYYAHPKFTYHTRQEREEIKAIKQQLEAEVTNPAEIETPHGTKMNEYEEIAASHDIVVYRPVAKYYVTAGVYREAEAALLMGKRVYRLVWRGDKPTLEKVEVVKEYCLPPVISALLGCVWGDVNEDELARTILEVGTRHLITDEEAGSLVRNS